MKSTQILRYGTTLTLIACLSACLSQPAAPVIVGNNASGITYTPPVTGTSTPDNNPYGATPYTPSGSTGNAAPYTPPPPTTGTATPSGSTGGSYIPSTAAVDINATQHTVVRGDTVYNISQRYRISQDNLRQWNNLSDNNINIGQVLRVKPADYVAPPTAANTTNTNTNTSNTTTANTTPPPQTSPPTQTATIGRTRTVSGIIWQRPVAGAVLSHFGGNQKGIKISGSAGEPVLAAADGKVVYNGTGLRGYGNLVIIQHNQNYLTAYGHNQQILVREGQSVRRGQSIATMGSSDAQRVQLHFELRRNGQPVDPEQYLPN